MRNAIRRIVIVALAMVVSCCGCHGEYRGNRLPAMKHRPISERSSVYPAEVRKEMERAQISHTSYGHR